MMIFPVDMNKCGEIRAIRLFLSKLSSRGNQSDHDLTAAVSVGSCQLGWVQHTRVAHDTFS